MVRSMTGYGRAQSSVGGFELTLEIRSVNHRYLDISVRVPRAYGYLEDIVKTGLKEKISRGKVDVYISVDDSVADNVSVLLNKPLLDGYIKALGEISDEYGLSNDLTVSAVMRLPDIFNIEKADEDTDMLSKEIESMLETALSGYISMSAAEGSQLAADITARLDTIGETVEKIEERSPECVAEYREKLEARLKEVLETHSVDEQRILTEAAIFADKISVSEETVRLKSHIRQLRDMLNENGGVGRKLDFLVQELNREANTIGSKANDIEISLAL
ncbi:MAG: YicC family protein, partial [Clostridiales bacterium]|nr:YicC family protein [Clostridiales bacterium]